METHFYDGTPEKVKQVLESELHSDNRIRIFFGDQETGKDWEEEHETIGYVGRSAGTEPILILLNNNRSMYGGAILTNCIIKITKNGRVLYQHPKYHFNEHLVCTPVDEGYAESVYQMQEKTGTFEMVAQFKKIGQARRWIDFIEGRRNSK